jgi:hypothetical protein
MPFVNYWAGLGFYPNLNIFPKVLEKSQDCYNPDQCENFRTVIKYLGLTQLTKDLGALWGGEPTQKNATLTRFVKSKKFWVDLYSTLAISGSLTMRTEQFA